jgi:SAF domain
MSTTTVGARPAPPQGRGAGQGSAGPVLRRRISKTRLLLAVGLVLACALAGVVVAQRVDIRVPVLAAARAISAGQTVTAGDVTTVKVAVESGVATVPASQLSTVVGRVATVPLVAGTLLSPNQFGGPVWPGPGEAVIAVPVKPGRLPSGLPPGVHVTVLVVPTGTPGGVTGTGGGQGGQPPVEKAAATVVSVDPAADQSGAMVVTLVLSAADATRVASASGDVALVRLGG